MKDRTRGIFSIIGTKPNNDLILTLTQIKTFLRFTSPASTSDDDIALTIYRDSAIEMIENEIMNSYILKTNIMCQLYYFNNFKNIYGDPYQYNNYNNVLFIDKQYIDSITEIRYIDKSDIQNILSNTLYTTDHSNSAYIKLLSNNINNNYYFPQVKQIDNRGLIGSVEIDLICGKFNSDGSNVSGKFKKAILDYIKSNFEACEDNNADKKLISSISDEFSQIYSFLL